MKDISNYIDRSEPTVRKWIDNQGLPVAKIGGAWISDTDLIDEWRAKRILEAYRKINELKLSCIYGKTVSVNVCTNITDRNILILDRNLFRL